MRKIGFKPVMVFSLLITAEVAMTVSLSALILSWHELGNLSFRSVLLFFTLFGILSILVFRLIQRWWPVPVGEIEKGSAAENRVFLYFLHYLMLFNPIIFNRSIPVPLMRVITQLLGGKLGPNTYSSGTIMDAQFVSMGADCIVGFGTVLAAHIMERDRISIYPIKVGDRVTIGGEAVIMGDVEIGDDAQIAVHSLVVPGTRVGAGETWGGSPARRIKKAVAPENTDAAVVQK